MSKYKIDLGPVDSFQIYSSNYNGRWFSDVTVFRGDTNTTYFNVRPASFARAQRVQRKLMRKAVKK